MTEEPAAGTPLDAIDLTSFSDEELSGCPSSSSANAAWAWSLDPTTRRRSRGVSGGGSVGPLDPQGPGRRSTGAPHRYEPWPRDVLI
jgi:hypothetical protein